eukprot:CAMPEP_0197693602 /NCGR_PEP_ID=MMETSP1338-20131121/112734_1 /TAXON_ID=43686 ORGANISM="Pelagodinium beii, Strain RCC1491" /NCGR_SAMPLE_ID=MMETSP1338 /ASSEMBLY_ACC=CAM_ASM_000754 /LENGTH=114 /DNA_ID=CAMNT_0043276371 /DNA_START=194 /DNA_END=538 /DNA_ORIENTATION=-
MSGGEVFAQNGLCRQAMWSFKEMLPACGTEFHQAPNGHFYREEEFIEWYSKTRSDEELRALRQKWKQGLCIRQPLQFIRPDGRLITSDSASLSDLACEEQKARRLQAAMDNGEQ